MENIDQIIVLFIEQKKTFSHIELDERIIEYDIDSLIYEGRSEFQKIQIVHSKTLGNMLILDELQSKWQHLNIFAKYI